MQIQFKKEYMSLLVMNFDGNILEKIIIIMDDEILEKCEK